MKLDELKNKAVVSVAEGERVGTVKDVLIDTDLLSVTALLLGGEPGLGVLPWGSIKNVGKDAITIDSSQLIQWGKGNPIYKGREGDEVMKLTVIDDAGTVLGTGHDLVFESTGRIECLEVKGGGVLGIGAHKNDIAPTQIRSVGPKIITVVTQSG